MAASSFMPMLLPGINRNLTKGDLKLGSVTAASNPRIHEGMAVPDLHLQRLTAIIEKHNMVGKIAIHMLHSHEPLREGEIKLERALKTVPGTWMRPTSADILDPTSLHSLAFKIDHKDRENTDFSLIPYEFGEGPSPIECDKKPLECMAELAKHIVAENLASVLALQVLRFDDLSTGPTAELEVEGHGTVTLPQSMQKIGTLVPVSWPTTVYGNAPQLSGPPPGQHWNVSTKPDGTKTHKVHVDSAESEKDILKSLADQGIVMMA